MALESIVESASQRERLLVDFTHFQFAHEYQSTVS